jgi:cell division protein FtsL
MTKVNALMLALLVLCGLAVVTSQHKARSLFVELEKEQEIAHSLEIEWGQLRIEQSTWAMHSRVEKIAAVSLNMRVAPARRVQLVPPLPASSQP